ncbi:MAG TPA: hypothetical protein VMM81_03835 [Acidimicrobiia bacterium]|nr:hypothetical protein [Acidimicrobiia bacterium]
MSKPEAHRRPTTLRSGLGRPMDFRLLSNRLSLALPLAAGAVAGLVTLLTGGGFADAFRAGIAAGGSSFLAWAVTRELTPDHPVAASLAAVAAPWVTMAGPPSLAVVAVWLLATRVVAGTTGAAPYTLDMVGVGAFAIWASTSEGGPPLALLALIATASSTAFDPRSRRTVLVGAALATAACLIAARVVGVLDLPEAWDSQSAWWVLAVALITAVALLVRVQSTTDRRPVPIDTGRVRAAIGWAGMACVVAVVWRGPAGMASMAPLAASIALTAAFSLGSRLVR